MGRARRSYRGDPGSRRGAAHLYGASVPSPVSGGSTHRGEWSEAEKEVKANRRRHLPLGSAGVVVDGAGKNTARLVSIGNRPHDPRFLIARSIRDALNPDLAPKPVRALADMSPAEQAEMRRLYSKPAKK